jgi:eukaryotic-like serine/threonine-protein kinase
MIGKSFGQYQIVASLGAGGMGEVYEALDTRLGRHVALKLLPEEFSYDGERVARFEREARILASLNHANIAGLHGLEQDHGRHFVVMELVRGETLADRIGRGPLPVEEAMRIACQIAAGLEAAHEKRIVHRDLKPANVKITPENKVKVLDFGLAKAVAAPETVDNAVTLPTLSGAETKTGVIMGTAAYMSPEQARGHEADERSDTFAFGCVLFEMLTGRRSFEGATLTETLASVLAREPALQSLPSGIHPRIHEVLRRCFEKEVKRRWQAIGDLRFELEEIATDPRGLKSQLPAATPPLWKRAIPVVLTVVVTAMLTAAAFRYTRRAASSATITRFSFALSPDDRFTGVDRSVLAISPDGTNIVYVANNHLNLKPMSEDHSHVIPGTVQGVRMPFFSPDGRWVAFYSDSDQMLKKIALTGGAPIPLCSIGRPFGATWYGDKILIGMGGEGVLRIDASGGNPETVIPVNPGEVAYGPQVLPGGDEVMFTLATGNDPERWDNAQVVVQSLKTRQRKVLIQRGTDARYVAAGYIVYAVGANLFAVPFDPKRLELTPGPVSILEGVMRSGHQPRPSLALLTMERSSSRHATVSATHSRWPLQTALGM